MSDFCYKIVPGNVMKYVSEKKEHIKKIYMHQIIYIIIILIAFFTTYWVFIKCINNKNDLSQTIALG